MSRSAFVDDAVLGVDPAPRDGDDDHRDRLGQEQQHPVGADAPDPDARQQRREQQAQAHRQDRREEDEDPRPHERHVQVGVVEDRDVVVEAHVGGLPDAPPLPGARSGSSGGTARCRRRGRRASAGAT